MSQLGAAGGLLDRCEFSARASHRRSRKPFAVTRFFHMARSLAACSSLMRTGFGCCLSKWTPLSLKGDDAATAGVCYAHDEDLFINFSQFLERIRGDI